MRKYTLIAALAVLATIATAHAESYTYMCKDGRKTSPVTVTTPNEDTQEGGTITWRGDTFANVEFGDGCRYKFVTTTKDGEPVELCTATQGYADLTIGRKRFVCQMNVRH